MAEVSVGSVAVEQVKWLLLSAVLDYLWDEESACVCVCVVRNTVYYSVTHMAAI